MVFFVVFKYYNLITVNAFYIAMFTLGFLSINVVFAIRVGRHEQDNITKIDREKISGERIERPPKTGRSSLGFLWEREEKEGNITVVECILEAGNI